MKKIEIDIPLEACTDNVRKITTEPLKQHYGGGAWEAIEDPATSVEDLKNSLKILKEKNEGKTKLKIEKIKEEIERRKNYERCGEKKWYPFPSRKEADNFARRWNEVTRIFKGEV